MYNKDISDIEKYIEEKRQDIELGKSLERLLKNSDFDRVINEELYDKLTKEIVFNLRKQNFNNEDKQDELMKNLEMISGFKNFIEDIKNKVSIAENDIKSSEELLTQLRKEG